MPALSPSKGDSPLRRNQTLILTLFLTLSPSSASASSLREPRNTRPPRPCRGELHSPIAQAVRSCGRAAPLDPARGRAHDLLKPVDAKGFFRLVSACVVHVWPALLITRRVDEHLDH